MSADDRDANSLPENLPGCSCFQTDTLFTWSRCGDMAKAANAVCHEFVRVSKIEELCTHALPYLLELTVISVLTSVAKTEGPALEYGSEELEREVERLLSGLEARVLVRSRETYARGRALGLTEETVRAMREAEGGVRQ